MAADLDGPSVPFEELSSADLVVDRVYRGGARGSVADDPLSKLLPVGNQGGFRYWGKRDAPRLVVLYTSGAEADWPDALNPATGTFTYFGDNRHPGKELHDSSRGGNVILRRTFDFASSAEARAQVPPYFLFAKAGSGRDVMFRGVLAPGAPGLAADEDLVAIWRSREGMRFQNYRATFTVLDIAKVARGWIDDALAGNALSGNCPEPWRQWVAGRRFQALTSTRIEYRTPQDQQPQNLVGRRILEAVHAHFNGQWRDFEYFAADLWKMADGHVGSYEVTRPTADGGRDAVGEFLIGPKSDPIRVSFALEAKLYEPYKHSVGVKEVSRLISRIRHREFGVLVTTSHVAPQAYQEIRADVHPIVVIAGVDIVTLLQEKGYTTPAEVTRWLNEAFPILRKLDVTSLALAAYPAACG